MVEVGMPEGSTVGGCGALSGKRGGETMIFESLSPCWRVEKTIRVKRSNAFINVILFQPI
jgi:hypothetical protein